MSLVLSSSIFSAILNVLAIIVLTLAAGFIILLLVDLVLGCIDGKRGIIFFRNRKNSDRDNEILLQYNKDISLNDTYYLQNNEKSLALDFDKQYEKENQEVKNNNIDFAKAEEEEKLVQENNKIVQQNDNFTFINKVSPEIEKEIEEENSVKENDEDIDFLDEDDDDDKSIEEILKAIKERNMRARNRFVAEEDIEPDFEDEIEQTEEEKIEDLKEEKSDIEEIINQSEEVSKTPEVNEEIEKLKAMVEELNQKLAEEQKKNAENEEKAQKEISELQQELVNKTEEDVKTEDLQSLEEELAKLIERQKQNEKDLKQNKKEYIPLARIARTLESDQDKLRRREAIVAKKKMVLFGVNNYVVDEEKEQKLKEDIDLLEGLRMSVEHCQGVMDANKDRYPILKRTNEILVRNSEELQADIDALQARIAKAKETLDSDNGTDDSNE